MGDPERAPGGPGRWLDPIGCAALGALLFTPSLTSGRLADDYVLLRTVGKVTSVLWPFSHNDLGQSAGAGHFYRPLWVLLNSGIYELSHDPLAAHIVNLALFGAICAEVVVLLRHYIDWRAALLAGIAFATFPSHGESVAWISGNTDLLAVALGLGALIVAVDADSRLPRLAATAILTALAMLAKEIAVVLPALAALLAWIGPVGGRESSGANVPGRLRGRPALAMLAAVILVLIARSFVVHGFGGYGGNPLTAKRAAGSAVSFSVAALSAPQLQLLAMPGLLIVPAALLALGLWQLARMRAGRERASLRLALAGIAWFAIALLPVLNQPLNLNTRSGDRLLLAPSVGLALTVAVILTRLGRRATAVAGLLAALGASACVLDARDWRTAGTESRRLLSEIATAAPRDARVVVLSIPTEYRAAHLYPDALDLALQQSGRPDLSVAACMPVHAIELRAGQVAFQRLGAGAWAGRATRDAPFDVPVLGPSGPRSAVGCAFGRAPGDRGATLGTALRALVRPEPQTAVADYPIYFDGRDMRAATR